VQGDSCSRRPTARRHSGSSSSSSSTSSSSTAYTGKANQEAQAAAALQLCSGHVVRAGSWRAAQAGLAAGRAPLPGVMLLPACLSGLPGQRQWSRWCARATGSSGSRLLLGRSCWLLLVATSPLENMVVLLLLLHKATPAAQQILLAVSGTAYDLQHQQMAEPVVETAAAAAAAWWSVAHVLLASACSL